MAFTVRKMKKCLKVQGGTNNATNLKNHIFAKDFAFIAPIPYFRTVTHKQHVQHMTRGKRVTRTIAGLVCEYQ
jgi:hypothetical protein